MTEELNTQITNLKSAAEDIHERLEELINQADSLETEIENTRDEVAELSFDVLGLSYEDLSDCSITDIVNKLVDHINVHADADDDSSEDDSSEE